MAKLVGIDIRTTVVRGVVLRTIYRKVSLEGLAEVSVEAAGSLEAALQQLSTQLGLHGEVVVSAVSGETSFVHRLPIPVTALKQLGEVLPYEVEAHVPVDIEDLVYDSVTAAPEKGAKEANVLAAAARRAHVSEHIALVKSAFGHEPHRVGVAGLPLANLLSVAPGLRSSDPVAFVDLGYDQADLVVIVRGAPVFARTASVGVAGLPDTAPRLAAALRQSFGAWANAGGAEIAQVYLVGGGADAPGATEYLSSELGLQIAPLPEFQLDGVTPEQQETLPRYAKAVALALMARQGASGPDLRQGALAFQRGYAFLKQKARFLAAIGVTLLASFVFATWAESSALSAQNEVLGEALGKMTKNVLGEEISDPDEVVSVLESGLGPQETDPQPKLDGFDVMVAVAQAVNQDIVHDIDELDMTRGQVKLRGIVSTTEEAETIVENLKKEECFQNVKIAKHNKVAGEERQKYVLEFEVRCEDKSKARPKDDSEEEGPSEETEEGEK